MQPDQFPSDFEVEPPPDPEPVHPYWVPAGVEFDALPPELQAALTGLITPAYRELVLNAPPGLAQSTGLTIVHLLWLEVLDQLQLGEDAGTTPDEAAGPAEREAMIGRLLRVGHAKIKASAFLQRLREFDWRCGPVGFGPHTR